MRHSVGMFRQHDALTINIESQLLQRLCAEWIDLNHSPAASATLRSWALHHPALAGLETPASVVDHIDNATEDATKSAVMAALLKLVTTDTLAGRILLQAMLPCLVGLAQRHCHPRESFSYEDRLQRTVAEFWAVVAQGPRANWTRIAANLKCETLRALTGHQRNRQDPWEDATSYLEDRHPELLEASVVDDAGHVQAAHRTLGDLDDGADVYEVLVTARANGILDHEQAQFLSDVFLSPIPETEFIQAAQRLGLKEATLRKRISRIKKVLRLVAASEAAGRCSDAALAS